MEQIQQTLARCRLWQRRRGGTHLRMEPQELGISRKVLQKVSSLVILLHASLHLQPVAKRQYMVSGTLAHQHCNGSFEVGRAADSKGTMSCRIQGEFVHTSVRPSLHPELYSRAESRRDRRTDGRMNRQTDGHRHRFPLYSTGHCPLLDPLPKKGLIYPSVRLSDYRPSQNMAHGRTDE